MDYVQNGHAITRDFLTNFKYARKGKFTLQHTQTYQIWQYNQQVLLFTVHGYKFALIHIEYTFNRSFECVVTINYVYDANSKSKLGHWRSVQQRLSFTSYNSHRQIVWESYMYFKLRTHFAATHLKMCCHQWRCIYQPRLSLEITLPFVKMEIWFSTTQPR